MEAEHYVSNVGNSTNLTKFSLVLFITKNLEIPFVGSPKFLTSIPNNSFRDNCMYPVVGLERTKCFIFFNYIYATYRPKTLKMNERCYRERYQKGEVFYVFTLWRTKILEMLMRSSSLDMFWRFSKNSLENNRGRVLF